MSGEEARQTVAELKARHIMNFDGIEAMKTALIAKKAASEHFRERLGLVEGCVIVEVISAERPKSQWGLHLTHGGLNVCGLANDGTALGGWANSVLSEIHWDKSKITYQAAHWF